MKISVSVAPAVLEIQDIDPRSKTATEMRELVCERISTWLASEAQTSWEIITESELAAKAA